MSGFETETPEGADPQRNSPPGAPTPGPSGLRPLKRLTSDDRLARINPETLAKTELRYYSTFAREFCRSDYNFCAAKMTLARGGKLIALEAEFRNAEAFFRKAMGWANRLHGRSTGHSPETVTLEIKHPLSGRLVRLLTLYDQLFLKTMEALVTRTVMPHDRKAALDSAEARIRQIPFLCIPDNDRYASEGMLLPRPDDAH
ncbi:AcaB family transcriptional regulator [Paraburkholderia fungorum]|jgi:hypothetical protein|uniref:AcaB family transcriptional regulator n=1 Tax=Paraburkholderia fungorum TaxID=134537 RepID=A0AAP5UX56_9BURK|nr:AcaB family transcriptional regulator [Paraburkholderia fungorum]MDT8842610.1 AcaB family transcriptional regulator [Paraburkholderia fungorum]PRZ49138.1 uncharacterized protein DUF1845 [Paraburkholderia fungorum]